MRPEARQEYKPLPVERIDSAAARPVVTSVRKSPLTSQVVDQLADRILTGELRPGTPLRQRQLADELGISRTPLREALQVLRTDGLVDQLPTGRFIVRSPTLADARDTYEVREVVDALAARLAARRASPEDLATLEALVVSIEQATDPFDVRRYLDAVTEFHVGVLRASGNRILLALETTIRMSTRVLYPRLPEHRERLPAAAREFRRLYEAMRTGDSALAEALAHEHVRTVIRFWIEGDADSSPSGE